MGGILAGVLLMMASGAVAGWSELSAVPRYTAAGIVGMMAAFLVVTVSMFWLAFKTRTVACRRIEGGYAHLEHAHRAFVERFNVLPL